MFETLLESLVATLLVVALASMVHHYRDRSSRELERAHVWWSEDQGIAGNIFSQWAREFGLDMGLPTGEGWKLVGSFKELLHPTTPGLPEHPILVPSVDP